MLTLSQGLGMNVPLQSGLGFASGQQVGINAFGGSLNVSLRGFLFTSR
jgi:hypothetical protein